ncbi:hypothetical protein SAMN05443572_102599 [Myxococcus fulvus]|uniref:DUF6973 domain-containing protein n=1 Tax=Myxococcus fulvus TaxID=33 RepID=A0A511SWK5_MYXFU|nr:hypothetical protein [Myxococcus fulvus]GEN06290.1 hypothetical protein MFU01_13270 [Myxococcus fulvus]SET53128.1 hypothetical protein SAMN05443572_102599 [Myxococcus fulvus]
MENIFFESTSSPGSGLYFVPGWTGRERVYALPRPQRAPVSERQAFAVDGRRILHATLSRADGTARLTVSRWRGGELYWVEFPCGPGAHFLQLSASTIAGGLQLLLLEERESGLVLHLAEGTAHQIFPCVLRRQSPRDVFTAGVAPEPGLAYLARRCEDRLDVERFKLPLGQAQGVTTGHLHRTRDLEFARDGLDLNKPRVRTWLEVRSERQAPTRDPLVRDFTPSLGGLGSIPVTLPEPDALLGQVSEITLSLHSLSASRQDDEHRLSSSLLAKFHLGTGQFIEGKHVEQSRSLFRFHQPFDVKSVSVVPGASVVLVDGTSLAGEKALPASVVDSVGELVGTNEAERKHFFEHPFDSIVGFVFASYLLVTVGSGAGDTVDAERHATWAALLSQHLGPEAARKLLANHEAGGPVDPMDVHNNEVGVFLGQNWQRMKYPSISAAVKDLLDKGYLMHDGNPQAKAKWEAYVRGERTAGRMGAERGNQNPQSAADGTMHGQPMPQHPSVPQPQPQPPQQPPAEQPQQPSNPRIGPPA